ncbi:Werner syndrome ATP-dependent helicase [Glycine max]|nr:Werner syndrome ATP-dependent helicase [Glycine max]
MAMTMTASNNNPTVFFNPTTSKYLVFYDGLTIETIITYKGSIVEEWIQAGKQRVVGLDTEWIPVEKTKKKVAILQLCIENKCLIIQLFHMDNIPQSLRSFLMDSNFEFVGVGVMKDLMMLN